VIAQLLGIKQDRLSLGPDMLHLTPDNIAPWGMVGDGYEEAAYHLGIDDNEALNEVGTLRASMLWSRPISGLSPARAGYFGPKISLEPSSLHLLSFYYRTEGVGDQGAGFYFPAFPDFMDYYFLADTKGLWRQFVLVGWVSQDTQPFWPYFAIFHKGTVWYEQAQVRQVTLKDGFPTGGSSQWIVR